jgi:amidohydrolase
MTLSRADLDTATANLGDILRRARDLYIDLHRHPELSGQEKRTAARFAEHVSAAGYEVTAGVGGNGVVARLHHGEGPIVMLRAELDALPILERTGLDYASTATALDERGEQVPVMHACGHDLHLAALAGAATALAATRERWRGTLLVVAQPAEETLSGARALLADGLYARFGPPDVVLAQHLSPFPAGLVAHPVNAATAGNARIDVTIHGRGGHGGAPHLSIDPVVVAAATVMRLQTIVARECDPAEPAVLTVGSIRAGHQYNVIADRAELSIGCRSSHPSQLDAIVDAVRRVVLAEAQASHCPVEPDVVVSARTPPNVNDGPAAARVRAAHQAALGPERVLSLPGSLASEDFPLFGTPGPDLFDGDPVATVYWFLGSISASDWAQAPGATPLEKLAALPRAHSADFAPAPGPALRTGVLSMIAAALEHLGRPTEDLTPPGPANP